MFDVFPKSPSYYIYIYNDVVRTVSIFDFLSREWALKKMTKKLESREWIIFRLPSGGWQLSIIKIYPYFFNLLSLIFHQINPLSRIFNQSYPLSLIFTKCITYPMFLKHIPYFFPNLLLILSILSLIPFFVHTPVHFLFNLLLIPYLYIFIYIYLFMVIYKSFISLFRGCILIKNK